MSKRKNVCFLIDKELGEKIASWAILNNNDNNIYVLCKGEYRKHFKLLGVNLIKEGEVFKLRPDVTFSINYWKKIDKCYTDKFKIINLHHSYNLLYRGRYTCTWAILNARKFNNWVHGTALHIIDDKIDRGEIICSNSCPIFENDTAYSLFQRVEKLAINIFKKNYQRILEGKYKTKKPEKKSFYYRKTDLDLLIDLKQDELDIYDRIRAHTFPNKPLPYAIINGKRVEFKWCNLE